MYIKNNDEVLKNVTFTKVEKYLYFGKNMRKVIDEVSSGKTEKSVMNFHIFNLSGLHLSKVDPEESFAYYIRASAIKNKGIQLNLYKVNKKDGKEEIISNTTNSLNAALISFEDYYNALNKKTDIAYELTDRTLILEERKTGKKEVSAFMISVRFI